jgi:putative addiction module component (TIGR02574 family)
MDSQTQALFEAAASLPEAERLLLVQHLLDTLPAGGDTLSGEELAAELDRRYAELERGEGGLVSWKDLKEQS